MIRPDSDKPSQTERSTTGRRLSAALAFGAALIVTAGPSLAAEPWPPANSVVVDRLVAVVNTESITLFDVRRRAAPFVARAVQKAPSAVALRADLALIQDEALDSLIQDILVFSEAKKLNLKVAPTRVDAHVKKISDSNGWTASELESQLKRSGFASIADYRRHTEREMMKSQVASIKVTSRIKIDEDEVDRLYIEAAGKQQTVREVRGLHVLLKQNPLAATDRLSEIEAVAEKIKSGELTFEDAARKFSEDTNAAAGGDLGWFAKGDFDPDFEAAAFELSDGGVSAPVKTQYGWHLIKLVESRERKISAQTDEKAMKREIRYRLQRSEFERIYQQWVRGLRAGAYVEVKDPNFGATGQPSS